MSRKHLAGDLPRLSPSSVASGNVKWLRKCVKMKSDLKKSFSSHSSVIAVMGVMKIFQRGCFPRQAKQSFLVHNSSWLWFLCWAAKGVVFFIPACNYSAVAAEGEWNCSSFPQQTPECCSWFGLCYSSYELPQWSHWLFGSESTVGNSCLLSFLKGKGSPCPPLQPPSSSLGQCCTQFMISLTLPSPPVKQAPGACTGLTLQCVLSPAHQHVLHRSHLPPVVCSFLHGPCARARPHVLLSVVKHLQSMSSLWFVLSWDQELFITAIPFWPMVLHKQLPKTHLWIQLVRPDISLLMAQAVDLIKRAVSGNICGWTCHNHVQKCCRNNTPDLTLDLSISIEKILTKINTFWLLIYCIYFKLVLKFCQLYRGTSKSILSFMSAHYEISLWEI